VEKNQAFFYAYSKDLIMRIRELTIKEMQKPHGQLYRKAGVINQAGDEQIGFDNFLNSSILDFICEHQDDFPVVLVSEETGIEVMGKNPQYFLLLDPLDGSNNIRPWYTPEPNVSISLAIGALPNLRVNGDHRAVDFSLQKEIFQGGWYYSTDEGAYFEGYNIKRKIKPSFFEMPGKGCIIGIDLDKQSFISADLCNLINEEIIVRRLGTSIMDLCQVASGQYDAYLSLGKRLKITDICQPFHLLEQAGAFATIKIYLDGKSCPELQKRYLQILLEEKKENLLKKLRFKVVAAGTKQLEEEILKRIKL
jgi:myo-inositol-1(or 4)-monophosphatase